MKKAAKIKAGKSAKVRRTPRRMGNSEARLHKMGGQRQKAKLDSAAKAAASRLEQMEKVEKPYEQRPIVFDIKHRQLHSPVLVRVTDVRVSFGERIVLDDCSFTVPNGKRTALIGPNGCGKTTLMEIIVRRAQGVQTCQGLRIGYFSQEMNSLDDDKSVLENAAADSIYDECFIRTILRRLLFTRDEVDKKAGVISGGERIRLSMAKIILGDYHLLLLDEPTNFLDIPSRSALEAVMAAYPGSVLFVSHDRAFLRAAADRVVAIKRNRAVTFEGGFDAYTRAADKK